MYKILRKEVLNTSVVLMVVDAPFVARKAQPGQFIILRVDENGERVPLTIAAYARYDQLMSKDDWNKAKDEQALILGAQFKCGQYVKLSPNFRLTMPSADGADNHYSVYVSCYFGL